MIAIDADHLEKCTILVVDDVPENVRVLAQMLGEQGYDVRPVTSGRLALQAARADPPSLILLDINMPEMDGFEVCTELKGDERLRGIPVIFISALHETFDKVKAFNAGAVDYITKPFQFEELLARVRTHLELLCLRVRLEKHLQELQDNYDQLRDLEGLRDSLTHMIVHDLRSPVTSILASLELLELQNDNLDEDQKEDVGRALNSTRALVGMISALLDVSRLESGEMPLNLEGCDLRDIASRALESLAGLAKDRDVSTEEPDVPVSVQCDAELIQRVQENLLGNALKFTPSEGPTRIGVSSGDGRVRLSVQDTGPGIPEEYREKIFEKFGQVEAQKERKKYSTGLGLAFCRLAVEAHGGEIGVESEVGVGSTFWFELPATHS